MKLVSYNMRSGGRNEWAAILAHGKPDILFVQESGDPRDLELDLVNPVAVGAHAWHPVEHGAWGSALAVAQGRVKNVPIPGFEGWVSGGEVAIGSSQFLAFSVHIPGPAPYVKTANRLMDQVRLIADSAPVILGGDWNFSVGRREADEAVQQRPGELAFLNRMEEEFGLVPAYRTAHPGGHLPQTLRWSGDQKAPYHCDGVFLPREISREVEGAEVLASEEWSRLSDHNPLLVTWS